MYMYVHLTAYRVDKQVLADTEYLSTVFFVNSEAWVQGYK